MTKKGSICLFLLLTEPAFLITISSNNPKTMFLINLVRIIAFEETPLATLPR